MNSYIQIVSYSNGRLLTGGGASTPGAGEPLSLQAPPSPYLNIELAGQKWSFLPDPLGSGAYFILDPAEACLTIPVLSLGQGADRVAAEAFAGGPTQLWYLFADTQGSSNGDGQPNCFLMSAQCMVSQYNKVLGVKNDSTNPGAAVEAYPITPEVFLSTPSAAYENQLWGPGGGEKWPVTPYCIPSRFSLQGNSNYFIGNYVVDIVRSARVEVEIDEDLVCDQGVSFQLNGFGEFGELEVWQQYSIMLRPGATSLEYIINNWTQQEYNSPPRSAGQVPIVYALGHICALPQPFLPKGTKLSIDLVMDQIGTIRGAKFTATGPSASSAMAPFEGVAHVDLTQTTGMPGPILAYQFLIVGYANEANTTFVAGAGRIIYHSNELIMVAPSRNFMYAWDSGAGHDWRISDGTGENSNMKYGFLPPSTFSPAKRLVQAFQLYRYVEV